MGSVGSVLETRGFDMDSPGFPLFNSVAQPPVRPGLDSKMVIRVVLSYLSTRERVADVLDEPSPELCVMLHCNTREVSSETR